MSAADQVRRYLDALAQRRGRNRKRALPRRDGAAPARPIRANPIQTRSPAR